MRTCCLPLHCLVSVYILHLTGYDTFARIRNERYPPNIHLNFLSSITSRPKQCTRTPTLGGGLAEGSKMNHVG